MHAYSIRAIIIKLSAVRLSYVISQYKLRSPRQINWTQNRPSCYLVSVCTEVSLDNSLSDCFYFQIVLVQQISSLRTGMTIGISYEENKCFGRNISTVEFSRQNVSLETIYRIGAIACAYCEPSLDMITCLYDNHMQMCVLQQQGRLGLCTVKFLAFIQL